jgi:SEC-C motif-containing protein
MTNTELANETSCPCQSGQSYQNCCAVYLNGSAVAPTAEKLMRSRYTAYVRGDIDYIKKTLAPESTKDFDAAATKKWSREADWKGLRIVSVEGVQANDQRAVVEFVATYGTRGQVLEHHEVSHFRKNEKGEWFFVSGEAHTHKEGESHEHHHHHAKPQTYVREAPKVGRNDPCPCGSSKKYKKCCGLE